MTSRLTIQQRIDNAKERGENTLNLSFNFKDIWAMMGILDIQETAGVGELSKAIVDKIVYKLS